MNYVIAAYLVSLVVVLAYAASIVARMREVDRGLDARAESGDGDRPADDWTAFADVDGDREVRRDAGEADRDLAARDAARAPRGGDGVQGES